MVAMTVVERRRRDKGRDPHVWDTRQCEQAEKRGHESE